MTESANDRLQEFDLGEALIDANSVTLFDLEKMMIDYKSKTQADFIRHRKMGDSIKSNIEQIGKYVSQNEKTLKYIEDIDLLLDFADSMSWCFPVETRICNSKALDRSTALMAGLLFTSLQYPWPKYGGRYKEPLFQLVLEDVSRVTGIDYGAGLLQLWVGPDCYEGESGSDHFRLIPTADVSLDQIAAIPHEISNDYFLQHEFTAGGKGIWPNIEEGNHCFQIVGFRERVITWNEHVDYIEIQELKRVIDDELLCLFVRQIEYLVSNFRPHRGHNLMGEGWFLMFEGNSPEVWPGKTLRVSLQSGKWLLHNFDSELDF